MFKPGVHFPKATMVASFVITFTFMHLADAFIQSDLQCIQAKHFVYQCYTLKNVGLNTTQSWVKYGQTQRLGCFQPIVGLNV